MSITSLVFIFFVFAIIILYYAVPHKFQWEILLIASMVFYVLSSKWGIIYILVTAVSIFSAAILIENNNKRVKEHIKENKESLSKDQRNEYKNINKKKRKNILLFTLFLNIGILCVLKYSHFAVEQINRILSSLGAGALSNNFKWIVPLGLSFYTFQSIGYIADVYWNKVPAQRNFLKMLLYISFFPQVTQGPISEYKQLSAELFKPHSFTYKNYSRGFQRMIWGFFKKMVIANMLSPYTNDIFTNYNKYIGITCFLGIVAHSIQLYADFSGYMDIMCGLCETLDIHLTENFKRPFFSKSISEFWRRWHISLGMWLKTYIYFPVCISKWIMKIGKKTGERFGKFVADGITTTIALIIVWFITGFWHGASWGYIVWGLSMGIIIITSNWLEPIYKKIRYKLRMRNGNYFWRIFRICRTCMIFAFIEVIPEVGTINDGFGLIVKAVTNFEKPHSIKNIFNITDDIVNIPIVIIATLTLFIMSVIQRKQEFRVIFNKIPFFLRICILVALVIVIVAFGIPATVTNGGFLYALF